VLHKILHVLNSYILLRLFLPLTYAVDQTSGISSLFFPTHSGPYEKDFSLFHVHSLIDLSPTPNSDWPLSCHFASVCPNPNHIESEDGSSMFLCNIGATALLHMVPSPKTQNKLLQHCSCYLRHDG
jgi:hypothetical protein